MKTVLRKKGELTLTPTPMTKEQAEAIAQDMRIRHGKTYETIADSLAEAGYRRPKTGKAPVASDAYILVNGSKKRTKKPVVKPKKDRPLKTEKLVSYPDLYLGMVRLVLDSKAPNSEKVAIIKYLAKEMTYD